MPKAASTRSAHRIGSVQLRQARSNAREAVDVLNKIFLDVSPTIPDAEQNAMMIHIPGVGGGPVYPTWQVARYLVDVVSHRSQRAYLP